MSDRNLEDGVAFLRDSGLGFTEIGARLGISRHAARRAFQRYEQDNSARRSIDKMFRPIRPIESQPYGYSPMELHPLMTVAKARVDRIAAEMDRQLFGVKSSPDFDLEPILFVPDTHIPYHHQPSWELMLRAARDLNPKHIVVMGDLPDFFTVSSHSKDPRRVLRLEWEVEQVNLKLDDLDSLGAVNKLYEGGNHEDRLRRYLEDKAPELFGFVDVPKLFRLDERGWKYTPYKQYDQLGKLYLTHDVGTSGRLSVFKAIETFEHSVVTAHTHRMSYIVSGNAVGEYKVSASFGWLGDVDQVDYMHLATAKKDWELGFGVGYLDPTTGYTYLTPVPIVRGTCMVNGVKYQ